jgi:hypothetical protein
MITKKYSTQYNKQYFIPIKKAKKPLQSDYQLLLHRIYAKGEALLQHIDSIEQKHKVNQFLHHDIPTLTIHFQEIKGKEKRKVASEQYEEKLYDLLHYFDEMAIQLEKQEYKSFQKQMYIIEQRFRD